MSHRGHKVKAMHQLEPPPKLFSLIQSYFQALCNLDYKALSVYFLMAGDSYCLFPETQINTFAKLTFTTARVSHPLGICLRVYASLVYFKTSALKHTARNIGYLDRGSRLRCSLQGQRRVRRSRYKTRINPWALPQRNSPVRKMDQWV